MWHRFEPTLRTAITQGLRRAAADGRTRADASDLAAGLASQDAHAEKVLQSHNPIPNVAPVAELDHSALAAIDAACDEAAADPAVKQITCDHLLIGLLRGGQIKSSVTADEVRRTTRSSTSAASAPTMDEQTRRRKIYDELSAIHPDFS